MQRLIVLITTLMLAACSDPRQQVTTQLADKVLLPAHQQWQSRNMTLLDSTRAWCSGDQELASLKQAFHQLSLIHI